jgi:hypothetical protein
LLLSLLLLLLSLLLLLLSLLLLLLLLFPLLPLLLLALLPLLLLPLLTLLLLVLLLLALLCCSSALRMRRQEIAIAIGRRLLDWAGFAEICRLAPGKLDSFSRRRLSRWLHRGGREGGRSRRRSILLLVCVWAFNERGLERLGGHRL